MWTVFFFQREVPRGILVKLPSQCGTSFSIRRWYWMLVSLMKWPSFSRSSFICWHNTAIVHLPECAHEFNSGRRGHYRCSLGETDNFVRMYSIPSNARAKENERHRHPIGDSTPKKLRKYGNMRLFLEKKKRIKPGACWVQDSWDQVESDDVDSMMNATKTGKTRFTSLIVFSAIRCWRRRRRTRRSSRGWRCIQRGIRKERFSLSWTKRDMRKTLKFKHYDDRRTRFTYFRRKTRFRGGRRRFQIFIGILCTFKSQINKLYLKLSSKNDDGETGRQFSLSTMSKTTSLQLCHVFFCEFFN